MNKFRSFATRAVRSVSKDKPVSPKACTISSPIMDKEKAGEHKIHRKNSISKRKPALPTPIVEPSEELTSSMTTLESAEELLKTEIIYLKVLRHLVESFQKRLLVLLDLGHPILKQGVIRDIFLNVENLLEFHTSLLNELTESRMRNELVSQLGQTMKKFIPFFKLYSHFVGGNKNAITQAKQLLRKDDKFERFVQVGEAVVGFSLEALLLSPAQRLPQYLHYLAAIHANGNKYGDVPTQSIQAIESSVIAIQKVANEITVKVKDANARAAVYELQCTYCPKESLVTPTRFLLKKTWVKDADENIKNEARLVTNNLTFDEKHGILAAVFNDLFVVVEPARGFFNGKVRHKFELRELHVDIIPDSVEIWNALQCTQNGHVARIIFSNKKERTTWLRLIQKHTKQRQEERSSLQPISPSPPRPRPPSSDSVSGQQEEKRIPPPRPPRPPQASTPKSIPAVVPEATNAPPPPVIDVSNLLAPPAPVLNIQVTAEASSTPKPPPRTNSSRNDLMLDIRSGVKQLRRVESSSAGKPPPVADKEDLYSMLQATMKNYRKAIEDEESGDEDDEWDN